MKLRFLSRTHGILLLMVTIHASEIQINLKNQYLNWSKLQSIPEALFGVHAFEPSPQEAEEWGIQYLRHINFFPSSPFLSKKPLNSSLKIMECLYDRYQPALILLSPQWKEQLIKLARLYGELAIQQPEAIIEFWNEPYLNWATMPGVNYDGAFYEDTGKEFGSALRLRSTKEVFPGLAWAENPLLVAIQIQDGNINYVATRYAHREYGPQGKYKDGQNWKPFELKEGFEFSFRGIPCKLVARRWAKDQNQQQYYSGPFNAELYNRMLEVFAREFKQAAPNAILIGGWDFNLWPDQWLPFYTLMAPTIDRCWQWLDGVTEHHYGNDSRIVAAQYELLYNYTKARYGKEIKIFNTEVGGSLDPEQPGVYSPNANRQNAWHNFTYVVRDMLCLLTYVPDKIGSRVQHMPQHDIGVKEAFIFLKSLRGKLLKISTNNPFLWAVATHWKESVYVYFFNDYYHPVNCRFQIEGGTQSSPFTVQITIPKLLSDQFSSLLFEKRQEVIHPEKGLSLLLPPKGTVRLEFPYSLLSSNPQDCFLSQYPAKEVLLPFHTPINLHIQVPEKKAFEVAHSCWLQLVFQPTGETLEKVVINQESLSLPPIINTTFVKIPFPKNLLQKENHIQLIPRQGSPLATMLVTASIVVEFPFKEAVLD